MPKHRRCILNCSDKLNLYKFPDATKDSERRKEWFQCFGIRPQIWKHLYACNKHFSHIMRAEKNLRREAVPDINLRKETDPLSLTCALPLLSTEEDTMLGPANELTPAPAEKCASLVPIEKDALLARTEDKISLVPKEDNASVATMETIVLESIQKPTNVLLEELPPAPIKEVTLDNALIVLKERSRESSKSHDNVLLEPSRAVSISKESQSLEKVNNVDKEVTEGHEPVEIMHPPVDTCVISIEDSEPETNERNNKSNTNIIDDSIVHTSEIPSAKTKSNDRNTDKKLKKRIASTLRRCCDSSSGNYEPIQYIFCPGSMAAKKRDVVMTDKCIETDFRINTNIPKELRLGQDIITMKWIIMEQRREIRKISRQNEKLSELKNKTDEDWIADFCKKLPKKLANCVKDRMQKHLNRNSGFLQTNPKKLEEVKQTRLESNPKEPEKIEYPVLYDDSN